ncbi:MULTISPECIES: glutathione S-transferase family protein [unclassified Sinorhizobium]|uniref:glutathione S-transferase family protein n=1 Tax=unclassified Sinorhizobium TaxID=2613772 RepID=UPI0024C22C88|nr:MULTISPECIES: glutathione S-transferase family protein [unclassified Sinorhizobium]MDK1374990.1 glutathione S-transferase family protein [Sinorhizobium sp. 6-70]MDK1482166.1 glutathione S-transferase family protein [Sinorhizobium sp. 6-117]
MAKPLVFGADYSVYVRTVRLTLEEKGIGYDLVPIDVFGEGGPPRDYLQRHPFGCIPAFEHDGFRLYETGAIIRYIDEAFEGPNLQPSDLRRRARVNQLISMMDAYAYPVMVWGIYVERVSKPAKLGFADEACIAENLPKAAICLKAMADLMKDAHWLTGDSLTLADLHAASMFDYFLMAPEGRALIKDHPDLASWWSRMAGRQSMRATKPAT